MKKNTFEVWLEMVFMRGSDKINLVNKYMIFPFSTRLRTVNIQKHCRKYWMLCAKLNLNQKRIMIKVAHKNRIKMEVVNEINRMRWVFHKLITLINCYCCGSGMHVLNYYDIRDTISRDQLFNRTVNVHSHHQQSKYKGDEQTV